MSIRRLTVAALVGCATLAAPAAAPAATLAHQIKKLQHDLKVVSKREKQDRADLRGFVGCLQFVDLTQYGDAAGTFGYLYSDNPLDPAATRATSAVDVTLPGDPATSFLIINPACSGRAARVGRSLGHTIVPRAQLVRARRGD